MGFYAPAQLVQDAKNHHVDLLPICINKSDYDHQLEYVQGRWVIRLGFRLIKGISPDTCKQLLEQRSKVGFSCIQQVKSLIKKQDELEALASADVFVALQQHRYQARWSLMNSESELALFQKGQTLNDFQIPPATKVENLIEDYQATRLSLKQHPIRLLKEAGLLPEHTCANRLNQMRHKQVITVSGLVIGRQRPGTSKGVTFMTLEDDTGNINVIVWLATARCQKKHFLKSTIVSVQGILERGDGDVTHVIAGKIEDKSHLLGELNTKSRDFH
jgi:error-prone DNA polymerase